MSLSRITFRSTTYLALGVFALGLASCSGEEGSLTNDESTGETATGDTSDTTAGSGGAGSGGATVGSGGASSGGAAASGGMTGDGGLGSGGSAASGGATSSGGSGPASGGATGSGGAGNSDDFVLPTGENSIAYTGCSMAYNIGTGYGRVNGKVMWNSNNYQTGAMVVQNWTDPNSASWKLFDQKMTAIGGKDTVLAIMVQICIFSSRATDQELHDMISSARQHVNPGTHIFIVGQPQYNSGHQCTLAGTGGAEWTDMKAQELANDPAVNEDLTYLGKFMLDNNNGEVMSDTCHATSKGEDAMGEQAKAFFGG